MLEEGSKEVTATKITRFLGTAPKNASELLPDTAAQVALNCKLYSGDLIPYPTPVTVGSSGRTGIVRTLHALRNPSTSALVWLSWANDVNIVTPATDELGEQRFYYTGDGAPKVSTYAKAVTGSAPYPATSGYYDLGLPLPGYTPVAYDTAFTAVSTSTVARDNAGNVTIVTSVAHNLKNGAYATISGFTNLPGAYSRTGTLITVTTPTDHGLSGGDTVLLRFTSGTATSNQYTITVTGTTTFTCTDSVSGTTSGDVELDLSSFNITTEVTVINSTTISYLSPGFELASRLYATGKVDLGGQIQARSYLFTWYTPWLEESIGSEPSSALFVKEGQIVTVANLPPAPPSGDNYIRAIRLYRTLSGTTDAAFYRLKTLWYPNPLTAVQRTSGVTSVLTQYPHALIAGDRVKISGCSVATVDASDVIVLGTSGQYSFSFAQAGSDISFTPASGTLYYDVSETIVPPDGVISAVQRTSGILTVVLTFTHDLAPGDLVTIDNCSVATVDVTGATVVGITSNSFSISQAGADIPYTLASGSVYFRTGTVPASSARYWGDGGNYDFTDDFNYRSLLDVLTTNDYAPPPSDLQGLIVVRNNILAGFSGNDVYFSEPGQFHAWPLAYKRSFESAVVGLATFGGALIVLTDSYPYVVEGNDPATMTSTRLSSRYPCTSARSIVETSSGVVYATHDGLAIYSSGLGAQILTRVMHSSDSWNEDIDPATIVATNYKDAYFAAHDSAAIVFESVTGPGGQATPSFVDIDFTFSASWYDSTTNKLYVAAGTAGDVYQWDDLSQPNLTMRWKSKTIKTTTYDNLGAARVVADYSGVPPSPVWAEAEDLWPSADIYWDAEDPVTFKLYVNKSLLFTTTESEDHVFRLPAGYKSDTFEVEVESNIRVRAIHLGNAASDLRNV